jgi:hypothetical protein
MPELAQSALIVVGTILMVVALLLSFVPILPGPVLVWGVGLLISVLDQFQRLTPVAAAIMTLIMLVGVLSDFWLPLLGMKTDGMSCLASLGSLIGGLLGTFFIPLPLLGTLIGCVAGALLVELVRWRQVRPAWRAGRSAFKMFLLGYAVEVAASLAIFATYLISLLSTR